MSASVTVIKYAFKRTSNTLLEKLPMAQNQNYKELQDNSTAQGIGHMEKRKKYCMNFILSSSVLLTVLILVQLALQVGTFYYLTTLAKTGCKDGASEDSKRDLTTRDNTATTCNCQVSVDANMNLLKGINQAVKEIHEFVQLSDKNNDNNQNNTVALSMEISQAANEIMQGIAGLRKMLLTTQTDGIHTREMAREIVSRLQNDSMCSDTTYELTDEPPMQKPRSCSDIKTQKPESSSGYYQIHNQTVYCEMDKLCGREGGWTRLAHLNMTKKIANCPSGFRLIENNGVRACGRPSSGGGSCVSVQFPSYDISYSEVCGRVVGYQYASTDAVDTRYITTKNHNDINSFYVDGVSITRGNPRQHVWTLMAALCDDNNNDRYANCPCNTPPGQTQDVQKFIGDEYFCESGNSDTSWGYKLYPNDPLWDGEGCGSHESKCCSAPGLPWFHKTFANSTTDYIELRVCCDQTTGDEDVPVSFYEIYVK